MNYLKLAALLIVVFSCDDIIEVEDISQKTVAVLAPTNNSVIANSTVTFSWGALNDADQYRLQISTPTFSDATQIVVDSLVTMQTLQNHL